MVDIVSSIPTEGNFIFCWNFFKSFNVNIVQKCQKCQICVENENLDWQEKRVDLPFRLNNIWETKISQISTIFFIGATSLAKHNCKTKIYIGGENISTRIYTPSELSKTPWNEISHKIDQVYVGFPI